MTTGNGTSHHGTAADSENPITQSHLSHFRKDLLEEMAFHNGRQIQSYFNWGMRLAGIEVNQTEFISTFQPVPQTGETVDLETAWPLSRCCEIAYLSEDQIRQQIKRLPGAPDLHWVEESAVEHTQGYVLTGEDYVAVIYRGTQTDVVSEQIRDLKTDAKFRKVPFRKDKKEWGEVHRGFYRAHQAIWPQVWRILKQHKGKKIWLAGHSLGGAIATMGFAELCYRDDEYAEKASLCTFGQPRVGNTEFKQQLARHESRVYRFVKNNDPITAVPFQSVGYDHIGATRYIDRHNDFKADGFSGTYKWWDKFASAVWTIGVLIVARISRVGIAAKNLSGVGSIIDDHNMGNYTLSLQAARLAKRNETEGSGSDATPFLTNQHFRLSKDITAIVDNMEGRKIHAEEVSMPDNEDIKGVRLTFKEVPAKKLDDAAPKSTPEYRRLSLAHQNCRMIHIHLPATFWYHEHELDVHNRTGLDLVQFMGNEEEMAVLGDFKYDHEDDEQDGHDKYDQDGTGQNAGNDPKAISGGSEDAALAVTG